jgi:hypothetical protein
MGYHDAAITQFSQWWRRATRCGHAFAQVAHMHGGGAERYFVKETRRTVVWGIGVPVASIGLVPATLGASLLVWGAYPLQALRISARARANGMSWVDSGLWGTACVLSRFPEAIGFAKYHYNRLRKRQSRIIEYKGPA